MIWQPVKDVLPAIRQECLLLTVESDKPSTTWRVATGYRNSSGWWLWWNGQHLQDAEVPPTYWMPFELPKLERK